MYVLISLAGQTFGGGGGGGGGSERLAKLGPSLGTRPFARGRRKGSGHHLTFELSPGRNVDLTNQKR